MSKKNFNRKEKLIEEILNMYEIFYNYSMNECIESYFDLKQKDFEEVLAINQKLKALNYQKYDRYLKEN